MSVARFNSFLARGDFCHLLISFANSLDCDTGAARSNLAKSYTFVEIDHEIFSMAILPSADSKRVVVIYKRKYMYNQACPEKKCG